MLTASNHNLDGYWEQPDATAEAQAGNWFHTGDGGVIDDDGYLVISDRKKDVIISGGENVSSIEVEDVLTSHPAVREVAVIGIPDEKWGELVTGLVVTDGSDGHRRGPHRALPRVAGRLQVPEADRVRRHAAAHRHREAAEVQAARAVLGRTGAAGELTGIPLRSAGEICGKNDYGRPKRELHISHLLGETGWSRRNMLADYRARVAGIAERAQAARARDRHGAGQRDQPATVR